MAAGEKRETILRAAERLLLKHGLRGTSMEAIAQAAGCAKPTLYAYFPDKATIALTLAEQLVAGWRGDFLAVLRGEGDVVQRVSAALTVHYRGRMRQFGRSPHAADLYGEHSAVAPPLQSLDRELADLVEAELRTAGVERSRLVTQLLFAASWGIGQKAQSPAELGPALRLLTERLIRPELADRAGS